MYLNNYFLFLELIINSKYFLVDEKQVSTNSGISKKMHRSYVLTLLIPSPLDIGCQNDICA